MKVEEWGHWQLPETGKGASLSLGRAASIDFISLKLLTARFMSPRTVRKENVLFMLLGKEHKCTREGPRVCCYMGTRIAVTYACPLTSWGKALKITSVQILDPETLI